MWSKQNYHHGVITNKLFVYEGVFSRGYNILKGFRTILSKHRVTPKAMLVNLQKYLEHSNYNPIFGKYLPNTGMECTSGYTPHPV